MAHRPPVAPGAAATEPRIDIPVTEAESIVLEEAARRPVLETERVPLDRSLGRTLAEAVTADRPFPPFDRATMDGVAIDSASYRAGRREYAVQAIQAAGSAPLRLQNPSHCIEIMTGAVLPAGADCVIPVEELHRAGHTVELANDLPVEPGRYVHRTGSDYPPGAVLLRAGTKIGPADIAVCASVGRSQVVVERRPRVAIVSTGDELVPVNATPAPHQIRISNAHAVAAILRAHGFEETALIHVGDDAIALRTLLGETAEAFDVLITSGGVSMGRFDLIPEAMAAIGVTARFHRVRQRPGRPLWFGVRGGAKSVVAFGLPGNPVSTAVCAARYVVPFLAGDRHAGTVARLTADVSFAPDLTYFLPVRISRTAAAEVTAEPAPVHGSGDFARLAGTDGCLELPAGRDLYAAGSVWAFYSWT